MSMIVLANSTETNKKNLPQIHQRAHGTFQTQTAAIECVFHYLILAQTENLNKMSNKCFFKLKDKFQI